MSGPGGRGQLVFLATEIARTMIIAIVTSPEAELGNENGLRTMTSPKNFSWTISKTIPNKAMRKQKIHGILLIYCPKNTISFKKQTFQGTKTRRFLDRSIENAIMNSELLHLSKTRVDNGRTKQCVTLREK